jgi:F420-0:gamma-glutamyl ligase
MKVFAVRTRRFLPPKDDLFSLIKESFLAEKIKLKEKSIVVITSKIVAIGQGRCVKINPDLSEEKHKKEKDALVKKEAQFFIDRKDVPNKMVVITIKNNILIPSAGIDESNANGYYILWPQNPFLEAQRIWRFLRKEFKIKKLGIIISDSHTTPLRAGMMGIAISYYGFNPLNSFVGKRDIFGRRLKMTRVSVADSLAVAAVFEMGESNEMTPIAIIEDAKDIKFGFDSTKNDPMKIDKKIDLYYPLIKNAPWKRK